MNETDSLRKVLYTKAVTATNALSLKCQIGDEPFTPPTDGSIWGEFWFQTTLGNIMELGGRGSFECTPGLIQFTLYAPDNSGDGPILRVGDQLKSMFNRQKWLVGPDGYVNIHIMNCQILPGIKDGHRIVIVDGSFEFYHRNPTPNTLLGSLP